MKAIRLTLKQQPIVPLEAECLSPDRLEHLSHKEICALEVYHGKHTVALAEFFDVLGDGSAHVELEGDLGRVKWIGKGMTHGEIHLSGNAGMHLGAHMQGGRIEVDGSTSDWLGAEMSGGTIHVHGDTGGQVGAAYRGAVTGMQNGTIIVGGAAGNEVGMRMKGGFISLGGGAHDFTGLEMKGGTIMLHGDSGIRTGAWMRRGTIISLEPVTLTPTFQHTCLYEPVFLQICFAYLRKLGVSVSEKAGDHLARYARWCGDLSTTGKGEVLVLSA